jgi:hypothetical protein
LKKILLLPLLILASSTIFAESMDSNYSAVLLRDGNVIICAFGFHQVGTKVFFQIDPQHLDQIDFVKTQSEGVGSDAMVRYGISIILKLGKDSFVIINDTQGVHKIPIENLGGVK